MIDFAEALDVWVDSGDSDASRSGEPAPTDWREWVGTLFPSYVEHPAADRQPPRWPGTPPLSRAPPCFCGISVGPPRVAARVPSSRSALACLASGYHF